MIPSIRRVLYGLALAASVLLTGCISLFPESEPVQLYRFGDTAAPTAVSASGEPSFNVLQAATLFDRAAAGDRILTVEGSQVAYIKNARWVSPAIDLFDDAVQQAFIAAGGPARLVGSGDMTGSDYVLQLKVRSFEARYTSGRDAAPQVAVSVQATLMNTRQHAMVAERTFSATTTTSENRVTRIVAALDAGIAEVLAELVAWVNANGATPG